MLVLRKFNRFFIAIIKDNIYEKMNQHNDYQFIQVPINLFYLMDANCSKVFITLVQMDSFYPKNDDGYFECAYKTLELACGMSRPVIKASLAGLYLEGILDVISVGQGKGKHTNRYKVNVDKFKDYEKTLVGVAIMTEDKPIHQVKYKGERFQVPWDEKRTEKQSERRTEKQSEKKVTTNIDNIENVENIDNIKNINNKEEMRVIPTEEKESYTDERFRNIVMVIEEKKPCTKEELRTIYINSFGELLSNYPSINYSLLRVKKIDSFYECYQDIVNELIMKINQESQRECSKEDVLETLSSYLDYIQYSYQ